jgi:hypothetical protein
MRFKLNKHNSFFGIYTIGMLGFLYSNSLKVHMKENFFGFDFEFCTISLLVMLKY